MEAIISHVGGSALEVANAKPDQLSRRALLSGAVASLALFSALHGTTAEPQRAIPAIPESAWAALAARITGGVLRPNDPRFRMLTRPQNLRYYNPPLTPDAPPDPDAPFGVVLPRDTGEIAAAITWAREVGLLMVPRSGGHSYAGCSTISGLVIHAGAMRRVSHYGNGVLDVEGGALNADVFAALRDAKSTDAPDGLAITHGRCKGVGVSAFLFGGGIGFAMREHGLGCDLVESVDLVLANGQVVTASAKDNQDLFWAVRGGGGGNLGFATRWRLRAVPALPVLAFNAKWRSLSKKKREELFASLVHALEAAPDRMGAKVTIYATKAYSSVPNAIDLTGQLRGSLDEFRSILGSALDEADSTAVVLLPYWDAQEFLEAQGEPNRYQETSRFSAKLSDDFIHTLFNWCRTWPGTRAQAAVTLFRMGGHISTIKPDETAFVHRQTEWLIDTAVDWTTEDSNDDVDRNLMWQRAMHDALGAHLGHGGSYQNFADPGLADPAQAYWGNNLEHLLKVKHRVDPDGVFTPPRRQGIIA